MARIVLFSSLVLLLVAVAAPPAAAQEGSPALSQIYLDWAAGPAHHLFTKSDRQDWSRVANDREAEDFVRLFWARRDPTPETADNEFRREFERRAAYADQQFGEVVDGEEVSGALTDRGRALILLGPPRRLQDPGAGGTTTGGDFGAGGGGAFEGRGVSSGGGPIGRGGATERFGVASEEVWVYEGDDRPEFMKKRRVLVTFRTKPGTEEVEIYNGEEALGYMGEAIERAVVRPELTLADLTPSDGGGVEAAAGEEGFGLFGADALDDPASLEALRASLSAGSGGGSVAAHLDAGAFQASDGTWIVPVQVAIEGPPPAAEAVLVGELVGASGDTKVSFRSQPEWKESRDQRYAKATVVAAPGDYTLRAGLQSPGGEVLWSAEQEVTVPAGGNELWLSQVVLSEDIHPMPQAQQVLEPWAWMGIEVVPEGDRTFAQGGVLWQYLHACHPALNDAGKPNLRLTVQLTGPASFRGPAPVDPVKAGDNCWVLASAYDLLPDRFPPGEYTMALTVRDSVAGESIAAAPVTFSVAPSGG